MASKGYPHERPVVDVGAEQRRDASAYFEIFRRPDSATAQAVGLPDDGTRSRAQIDLVVGHNDSTNLPRTAEQTGKTADCRPPTAH